MASCSLAVQNCTIGILTDTNCHLKFHTNIEGIMMFAEIDKNDQQLIQLRTKLEPSSIVNVCYHHFARYITYFAQLQRTCVNPFGSHKKSIPLSKGKVTNSTYLSIIF